MRSVIRTLILASCVVLGEPSIALAQASTELDRIPPRRAMSPFAITGTVLGGLGAATIMASGICWLVAASDASRLDDECPGKVCVEGSSGQDALERARDAKSASIVLFAIGLPVATAGGILLLYSDSPGRRRALSVSPSVGPDRAGADLHYRF